MSKDRGRQDGITGAGVLVVLLPLFLAAAAAAAAAWFAARIGARYRFVKLLSFPAGLLLSNLVMVLFLVPFMIAMLGFTGHDHIFNLGAVADVTLWTAVSPYLLWVFGAPKPEYFILQANDTWWLTILLYQFIVWIFAGRMFTRQVGMAMFDSAVVRIARSKGMLPYDLRVTIARNDKNYANDALYYEKRGAAPLAGMLSVALSGENPGAYY